MEKNLLCRVGTLCTAISLALAPAAHAELYQQPLTGNLTGPTLLLLTMQRDHRLFMDAYDDYTDLDGDGFIDSKYKPNMTYLAGKDASGQEIRKPLDYYGYFDSYLCYKYGDNLGVGSKIFYPVHPVRAGKKCSASDGAQSDSWSGDFLNYLTTTRADAMRKVLYGGKRWKDFSYGGGHQGETVIERAQLPDDLHAFGKEYTSIAVDGYDIRDYAPLPLPAPDYWENDIVRGVNKEWLVWKDPDFGAGYNKSILVRHRHLFANMSLLNKFLYGLGADNDGLNAPGGASAEFRDSREVPSLMVLRDMRLRFDGSGLYDALTAGEKNIYIKYEGRIWEWVAGDHYRANNNLLASPSFYYDPITNWFNPMKRFRFSSAIAAWRVSNNPYGGAQGPVLDRANDLYDVRVQVCAPGFDPKIDGPDAGYCKAYGNGTHKKPVGVLHDFGEDDRVLFGLLTGSYTNSMDGGVLRKNIASFRNEINPATGQFTGVPGIVSTLDRLKITGYNYRADITSEDDMILSKRMNMGDGSWHRARGETKKYTDNNWWGNPIGEMMYEGYRYFAGKEVPTSDFSQNVSAGGSYDTALGLPLVTDWSGSNRAFRNGNQCSRPIQMVLGDITPTFDSDKVPGSAFLNFSGDISGLNAADKANTIWSDEGLGSQMVFIGEKQGGPEAGLPTAKSASGFSHIRGLTPEDPTLQGTYYSAGVAKFAKETDLHAFNPDAVKGTSVQTLAVALSGGVPKIQFPVDFGGKRNMVTVIPFSKHDTQNAADPNSSADWGKVNRAARLFVENMANVPGAPFNSGINGGQPYYKFRVIFDEGEFTFDGNADSGNTANNRDIEAVFEIAAKNGEGKVTVNVCTGPWPEKQPPGTPTCDMDGQRSNGKAYSLWLSHVGYVIDGVKITSGKNARFVARTNESRVLNFVVDKPHLLDVGPKVSGNFSDALVQAVGGVTSSATYWGGGLYPTSFRFNAGETFDVDTTASSAGGAFIPHDPLWYAAKYGGYKDNNKNLTLDAGDEVYGTDGKTPRSYFRVTNPSFLRTSIATAIRNEILPQGTEAPVTPDPKEVKDGLRIYQSKYNAQYWSGQFGAKDIDLATFAESWIAKDKVDDPDTRAIYSYRYSATAPQGIAFNWAGFNAAEQATFFANRQDILAYLRGDRSQESDATGGLRKRDPKTVLGDFINSGPVISSPQSQGFNTLPASAGGSSYLDFLKEKAKEPQIVYVGGNDGMLHGFNVQAASSRDGFEVIAYVPRYALQTTPGVTELAKQTYIHRYLVDGPITISDYYNGSAWGTALVATQGAGGKAVFALDVAKPRTFSAANVLWEFTHPELGNALGAPVIQRLPDGAWYAIVANGFESLTCDPTGTPRYTVQSNSEPMPGQPKCTKPLLDNSGNAVTARNAKLFLIKLKPNLANGWTADEDYFVIHATDVIAATTPPSPSGTPMNGTDNGLTGVTTIDGYAYAGDLQGNVWKFDLNAKKLLTYDGGPIFTAMDTSGNRQPITVTPAVTQKPGSSNEYCVNVGTGRYVYTSDLSNQSLQSVYGLIDKTGGSTAIKRGDLQQQTIIAEGYFPAPDGRYWRTTSNVPLPAGKPGWYLDLAPLSGPREGERVVDGLQVSTVGSPRWLLVNTQTPTLHDCDARRFSRYFTMDNCSGAPVPWPNTPTVTITNADGTTSEVKPNGSGTKPCIPGSPNCDPPCIPGTPGCTACTDLGPLTWVKDDCQNRRGIYYQVCRSNTNADGKTSVGPLKGTCPGAKRTSWRQLR